MIWIVVFHFLFGFFNREWVILDSKCSTTPETAASALPLGAFPDFELTTLFFRKQGCAVFASAKKVASTLTSQLLDAFNPRSPFISHGIIVVGPFVISALSRGTYRISLGFSGIIIHRRDVRT